MASSLRFDAKASFMTWKQDYVFNINLRCLIIGVFIVNKRHSIAGLKAWDKGIHAVPIEEGSARELALAFREYAIKTVSAHPLFEYRMDEIDKLSEDDRWWRLIKSSISSQKAMVSKVPMCFLCASEEDAEVVRKILTSSVSRYDLERYGYDEIASLVSVGHVTFVYPNKVDIAPLLVIAEALRRNVRCHFVFDPDNEYWHRHD